MAFTAVQERALDLLSDLSKPQDVEAMQAVAATLGLPWEELRRFWLDDDWVTTLLGRLEVGAKMHAAEVYRAIMRDAVDGDDKVRGKAQSTYTGVVLGKNAEGPSVQVNVGVALSPAQINELGAARRKRVAELEERNVRKARMIAETPDTEAAAVRGGRATGEGPERANEAAGVTVAPAPDAAHPAGASVQTSATVADPVAAAAAAQLAADQETYYRDRPWLRPDGGPLTEEQRRRLAADRDEAPVAMQPDSGEPSPVSAPAGPRLPAEFGV